MSNILINKQILKEDIKKLWQKKKRKLKDTLNLPKTTLAMRANATVRELEIQKILGRKQNL